MRKKLTALVTAAAAAVSAISFGTISSFAENAPRQMEHLDRGTVAIKTNDGVYLSWRLLGDESLSNQAFNIYKNGKYLTTTGSHDATCYTDTNGSESDKYVVVPRGVSPASETAAVPWSGTNYTDYGGGDVRNQCSYMDIPIVQPSSDTVKYKTESDYTYSANDSSAGDLDGDGQYELVVKWDPSNSGDVGADGYRGGVFIDGYEISSDNTSYMWRIDLGINIRAGSHYTQYIVYDFDGDGKSEIACKTAPGSKDGLGRYVSEVGKNLTTDAAFERYGNDADYRTSAGVIMSGPEWLTIFDGETGAALQTVNYDPPRSIKEYSKSASGWGDNYGNRSERYLAGVAYLDGKTPSLIMTRGYYTYSYAAAYQWDGENLTEQWLSSNSPTGTASDSGCVVKYADGTTKQDKTKTLYGQGCHSLSVADVDNDGFDEIIFGAAILDHNGMVLQYNGRGHGDALHVSDFDNDGNQEVFQVHEAGKGNEDVIDFAIDIRRYNGDVLKQSAVGDVGRGIIGNFLDTGETGKLSQFWSSNVEGVYNFDGSSQFESRPGFINFMLYWDGDLAREVLDRNMLGKLTENGWQRFLWGRNTSYFPGASANNGTKATPCLSADIFGDWREEVIFKTGDNNLRLFMSCIPTAYRLTTLMHDSQYRTAIAWQNVAYNQPPHQSYYIGTASLAKSGNETLNYLEPEVPFTNVTYPSGTQGTPRPTIEPTPTPEPTPIAESIYANDCSSTDGWEGNSIAADNGTVALSGSGSGNRSHLFVLPDSVTNIKSGKIRASFDFYLSDNIGIKDRSAAQIALLNNNSSAAANNNGQITDNVICSLTSTQWNATRNDTYFTSDANDSTFSIAKQTWYTLEADINYDTLKVNVTVKNKNSGAVLCESKDAAIEDAGLKGIYILSPRYDSGTRTTQIDNISISKLTDPVIPKPTDTPEPTANPTDTPEPTANPTDTPEPTANPTVSPDVSEWIEYDSSSNEAIIKSLTDKTGTVIFASFDNDGKLVSICVQTAQIIAAGETRIAPAEGFVVTENVKAYAWESLDSMKPLF